MAIQRTVQRVNGSLQFSEPKAKRSNRRISLSNMAVVPLRQHRVGQRGERLRHGLAWEDMDMVFANELGRPIEART